MGCEGCQGRGLNAVQASASAWKVLTPGSSTGIGTYIYSSEAVSRYRTIDYGANVQLQLFIENTSPGNIVVPTQIATLPADIGTSIDVGFTTAYSNGSTTPTCQVSVNNGALYVLCNAVSDAITDDSNISISGTFALV
jgi:hypothetical protein